ncbi:oligosaccharide biosynthesis protein Alg14 like-domain-containing protein [Naematelia encephala]|uniref:UDP-N-acetylglucosamine transferase subunit ALG14 n=1 Tax=Naematelia encephala TaxID=71784 RepID=A0A1Y2B0B3_9TREE|nr:oligosaccharide biosynthesis protein Alg14 like-domain-containing protein [Naematelia encephala]
MDIALLLISIGSLPLLLALRIYLVLPAHSAAPSPRRKENETCSLGVFLGSGGHTAEMIALISTLDMTRYTPRTYVHCRGDDMSLRLVSAFESRQTGDPNNIHHLSLPRARKVGQGKLSTFQSGLKTLRVALWYTFLRPLLKDPSRPWVEVLLINGPGTCVVLVAVAWIRRIIGLSYTRIIYVESFARVTSLSLSGKILKPFVDVFIVQWPDAAGKGQAVFKTEPNKHESGNGVEEDKVQTDKTNKKSTVAMPTNGRVRYLGWLI